MNASVRQYFFEKIPLGQRSAYARTAKIPLSTLYHKPKRPAKDLALKSKIEAVLKRHRAYGPRTIARELGMNHKAVARIMKLFHLRPKIRRKRKRPRNKGDTRDPCSNLLERLCPIAPDIVWAGDFTEFLFHGKRMFYATVIDNFTREILGWSLGTRHNTRLVLDALADAIVKRGKAPWIFHSDQGSEYTAHEFTAWLLSHNIRPSWSPKGKPWNNGIQESYFNTFKREFDPNDFSIASDLFTGIAECVRDYNQDRIHGALKMPPQKFYLAWKARRPGIMPSAPQNLAL